MAKIGVTDATLGACVKVGQEHDTSSLADGSAFPANAVTAMSAAQWVAQNTGAGIDRRGAGVKIGSPIAGTPAVTGTGTAMVPNAAFYANTTWGRDTYIVVENARVTVGDPKYDAKLANVVSNAADQARQHAERDAGPGRFGEEEVRLPRPVDHDAHPLPRCAA